MQIAPEIKPRTVALKSGKSVTIQPPPEVADVKGKKKRDDDKWWLLLLLITASDIARADSFWRLHAPRSFAGLLGHTNGFGFDELSQQYTKNGQPQDDDDRRMIFAAFLLAATVDMERQAGRMARGRIPLDQWEESQAQAVKSLYIAADAFGRGGVEFVDEAKAPDMKEPGVKVPTDLPGALGDAIARLKRFSGALEQGDAGSVTAIIRRAGLYAGPAHGVMELARRQSHLDATDARGVKIEWLEQNILDDESEHCRSTPHTVGCPEITDAGPAPIGSYDPPGTRTCSSACRCHMAYSVAAPNKLSDVKPNHLSQLDSALGLSSRIVNLPGGKTLALALAGNESVMMTCPGCGYKKAKYVPCPPHIKGVNACECPECKKVDGVGRYKVDPPKKMEDPMAMSSRTINLSGGRKLVLALEAPPVDSEGEWRTINGAHVLIGKGGMITKGPKHLVGKSVAEVGAHGKASPAEKAKPGYHRIERNAAGGYVGTHTADGIKHVSEHEERLKKLGISPGYGQIHLAEDPMAMRQAYQTDAAGREGRIYSDEHHAIQKKKKHARVNEFRKLLPGVEKSIANDPSEEAAVLRLIRPTGIRQGSETDTKAKQKAYGATTMRSEHVVQENGKTILHFIGKDGVQNHIPIDDERLAGELKERAKSGGKLYNTNENKVRAHLDKLAPGFLVKDLRTVVANETAEKEIRGMSTPKTLPDLVKARMEVATKVAHKLGNTPVIALGEYINPERFSRWETSAANNEQAIAIERYAKTKGIDTNAAAKEWIGTHAKAFRENFNQRLESPKKVKAYDDGNQVSGKIGSKGRQAAMALGGWSFAGTGAGNGFGTIRRPSLHQGRNSFAGSDRRPFGRINPPLQLQGKTMSREITLRSGRTLTIEAPEPTGALALYNHNHDELGLFTDAETGSDHASSKAHAASAMAKKQNTKSAHRSAAAYHREAADRAEDAGNDRKADKHSKMAEAHESAAKGISWK